MLDAKSFYGLLMESQFWERDQLVGWQRGQLLQLLAHAKNTVPFYRFRLNRLFRADGAIDWERWHEVPVLTRKDVSEHFDDLCSTAPVIHHGPLFDASSSGSTGHPVTVRTTRWLAQMTSACNWRAQRWAGLDWSQNLVGIFGPLKRPVGTVVGPWGPPFLPGSTGHHIYTTYDTDNLLRLRIMAASGAAYLAATPSNALVAAGVAEENGIHLKLDSILTRGNKATEFERAEFVRIFGARVVEMYSSKECGAIAHPCPEGEGWHVNAEAVLLEVLDDEDRPVRPGEEGRAVITPFGMTGFPLIRYDQGDRIVQGESFRSGERCRCGRALPHFHSISGRVRDEFRTPQGAIIRNLPEEARKMLGAGRWQVAQVGEHLFEVRYVPRDWGVPRDLDRFAAMFRETFYPEAELRLVEVTELALNARGKFKERVVEWRPGDSPP